MKPATALMLLGAALLLISGGNGEICSAVKEDVDLFLYGTTDEYVNYVGKFNSNPLVLDNARFLKQCVDANLTAVDKANASSGLVSLPVCAFMSVPVWRSAPPRVW
ncbi:major allergen I polypeptide chain 1-like [Fukomys damarensis]|uniref:Major allergen I polypeptide chain 1 n=1 Tax=Fukomys damarensis TaxID=885580 RepID=A0A091DJR1_FUKDA|nr:major allergen I polypeptide chain 1-like [Fukomys damarensis]KFO32364.1 Major allergen I polypeptide chain 1 [Fukomys damarensis]